MRDRDLNRVERLARRICKSLEPGAALESAQFHGLLTTADRRRTHLSPRWRQQIRSEAEDVPKAVELALGRGWLVEREGRLSITPTGIEMGKRSRVGSHKARLDF